MGSGSKGTANQTGKPGNASGQRTKEARGASYERGTRGKHPPNTVYKGPKD